MRKAKDLEGLQECLGSYKPSLLAVDVPLCWRWRHGNQRQSDAAILPSSGLNTLYNAPTILEIMKDLGVVDFLELLGTRTVSHRLLWMWNDSHTIFFCQNGPEHANTCYAMFYSIVSIWRMTTPISGRNVLTFITGEMLATSCIIRKVVQLSCHLFCVNLHTFNSEKQLSFHPLVLTYTHSTVKSSSAATSLVITYTHSTVKSSSAATPLVLTYTH